MGWWGEIVQMVGKGMDGQCVGLERGFFVGNL